MNILILGNGFDRAHNLPTRYTDFLDFCEFVSMNNEDWVGINDQWSVLTTDQETERKLTLLGKDMYFELKKLIQNNFWLDYFNAQKNQNGKDAGTKKWIDFENEMKIVAEILISSRNPDGSIALDEKRIPNRTMLMKFQGHSCKEVFDELANENKKLVRALEIYMDRYVNRLPFDDSCRLDYLYNKKFDKILSFNYTDTYTKHYRKVTNNNICYIHGRAKANNMIENCNLVLGFDDHYMDNSSVIPEVICFEKYCQRIINRCDNQYFKWLEEWNAKWDNHLYIYGHSLAPSDGDVLKEFIMSERTITVTIYCYSEIDRAEKIKNLAVVLTPNELIKLSGGSEPRIRFEIR